MFRNYACFLLAACCTLPLVAAEKTPNTLSPMEEVQGFELLFDGTKLDETLWQGALAGYPVEDGAIVCRKGGNLMTARKYKDFVFRFEFKLPPAGNNGVGIRATAANKNAAYDGMELQVLDNSAEKYLKLKPYQFHGSIYGIVPALRNLEKNDFQKPIGQWNRQEIIVQGTKIKVVLNGTTILDADIAEFKDKPLPDGKEHPGLFNEEGYVGFLGHNDPVAFRSMRIKELQPGETYPQVSRSKYAPIKRFRPFARWRMR